MDGFPGANAGGQDGPRAPHFLDSSTTAMALESSGWTGASPTRVLFGASVGRSSQRLKLALIRYRGRGWQIRRYDADAVTAPLPDPRPASIVDTIASHAQQLLDRAEIPSECVDVLGLGRTPNGMPQGLVASLLAERTGFTTVHGFEFREPSTKASLSTAPDWMLHRPARQPRLLVHLGATLRLTLLEPGEDPARSIGFDAGPCCEFLDGLAHRLSQGRFPFDPTGHFAVQGRQSEELLRQWMSHPYLQQAPPKSLGEDDFGLDFCEASLTLAQELRLSARDVLCSATHFVVSILQEALRRYLPFDLDPEEVRVSGGGSWNGLLWKLVVDCFAPTPVVRTDTLGVPAEAISALHAGLLAFFAMENLGWTAPTEQGHRRILGQITPGSPQNWDRWVCHLADRLDAAQRRAA